MKSKAVALPMSDLGVTKTHSQPHVFDDNPFSEAQFKTLKYRPGFPDRFGCIQDAKAFCRDFFGWHKNVHYHSGLNWLTPAMVHHGRTDQPCHPAASGRLGLRASRASRAFRQRTSNDRRTTGGGLDQPAC